MTKEFNITGTCIPSRHFMADTSGKLKEALAMIERGRYFIINRPRQYGKTTMMSLLLRRLKQMEEYLPISISFEGLHNEEFADGAVFGKVLFSLMATQADFAGLEDLAATLRKESQHIHRIEDLSSAITKVVQSVKGKKVVLFIDEVDKSSNNQLFVSFLGMLRTKYLLALEERDFTFHSVVLAGVHDVKTLKLKLRPDEEKKLNSPWNIATEFTVNMALQPHEILPMLQDYMQERGVEMDAPAIAEELFHYTSGYPFLVSKLCKMLDEETLPKKTVKEWTKEDLADAVSRLVYETNTNFDSLIANLENYPELYKVVYDIVVERVSYDFTVHDTVINMGVMYGIFMPTGNGRSRIKIHNRIYEELIYNYLASKAKRSVDWSHSSGYLDRSAYLLPGNRLDLMLVLTKFQTFMQEQYSRHDRDFLERHGRLVFLAFIKPIINGGGYDFKEPQISEEKRLDVVITFYEHKYVVEMKIWNGESAHKKGLQQLSDYLGRQHLNEGYLLIFDHSAVKTWKKTWLRPGGKKVYAVWV